MRRDDGPEEGRRHEKRRRWRSIMGFVMMITFLGLYLVEPPFQHSHRLHEIFTILGAAWSAHMMNEKVTARYVDRILSIGKKLIPGLQPNEEQ